MNSFTGAVVTFPNLGIHLLLAEVMKFRKQLTLRDDFKSQSGWNDALNAYMVRELEALANTLESITYNPSGKTLEELKGEAADTNRQLSDDFAADSIGSDNLVMPTSPPIPITWDLSGADPDIPQVDVASMPNDIARSFVKGLDRLFVEATRLDSRHQRNTVTKYESRMLREIMNELYTICQRKGGEANRSDIPNGTLPNQYGGTFNGGGAAGAN